VLQCVAMQFSDVLSRARARVAKDGVRPCSAQYVCMCIREYVRMCVYACVRGHVCVGVSWGVCVLHANTHIHVYVCYRASCSGWGSTTQR